MTSAEQKRNVLMIAIHIKITFTYIKNMYIYLFGKPLFKTINLINAIFEKNTVIFYFNSVFLFSALQQKSLETT